MPFNNIGGKIKGLALVLFWLGVAGSFLAALVCMVAGYATEYLPFEQFAAIWLLSVVIFFGGMLASWIGCFFTYGFGELIAKTAEIAQNTRPVAPAEDGDEEEVCACEAEVCACEEIVEDAESEEDGFVASEEVTE